MCWHSSNNWRVQFRELMSFRRNRPWWAFHVEAKSHRSIWHVYRFRLWYCWRVQEFGAVGQTLPIWWLYHFLKYWQQLIRHPICFPYEQSDSSIVRAVQFFRENLKLLFFEFEQTLACFLLICLSCSHWRFNLCWNFVSNGRRWATFYILSSENCRKQVEPYCYGKA